MNNLIQLSDIGIIWIVLVLLIFDISATNYTIRFMRKYKPKVKYDELEMNPFVVWGWNKFGINKGSILIGIFQIGLASLFLIFAPRDIVIALIGSLIIVVMIHVTNLSFIIKKNKEKKIK